MPPELAQLHTGRRSAVAVDDAQLHDVEADHCGVGDLDQLGPGAEGCGCMAYRRRWRARPAPSRDGVTIT